MKPIIRLIDHLITIAELTQIREQKGDAVRLQAFDLASKLLNTQRELECRLLSIEELNSIREELIKQEDV